MRRVGIDFRATAGATVLGLSGVLAYRYALKPALAQHPDAATATPTPASAPAFDGPAPPIERVDTIAALEAVGGARAVVLITRGFSADAAAAAVREFEGAARAAAATAARCGLRFYVLDDATPPALAEVMTARVGVTHRVPFVVVLDRYASTETRYLMTEPGPPASAQVAAFVAKFAAGALKPVRLGQPRPPRDRSARFPALYEVVTDSFADVVLDPRVDVLVEGYTPKCDACKAFAPRWRMLAGLVEEHLPGRQLRVAALNILDNDRPLEYMPERWTPTIRLFPAVAPGDPPPPPGLVKRSLLLQYDDSDGGDGELLAVPTPAPPATPPPGGDNAAPAPPAAASAAAGTPPPKVVLPTIPELLRWVAAHTGGRVVLTPAMTAAADALESEAADIERAYAITLQFMEVWHQFASLAADEEDERRAAAGAGPDAGEGPPLTPQGRADAAVSAELRKRIVATYKYILDEAGAGSAPGVVARMQAVSDVIASHRVMERLGEASAAAAAADEAAAAAAAAAPGGGQLR